SGEDFEFWSAHLDGDRVVHDGPAPGDSRAWAAGRVDAALRDVEAAGLPTPEIFEYPHDAGSAEDSFAVRARFATAYHRGLYFGGQLDGIHADYTHAVGVLYPYPARDV